MLIFIFAIINAILLLSPAFLKMPFLLMPTLKVGDVTDILTPLILVPLYFLLFQFKSLPSRKQILIFIIFAALLAEGQGMHLSANSIDNLLNLPAGGSKDSPLFMLVNFFDEGLSHYLWFIGVNGITLLLIYRQLQFKEKSNIFLSIVSALIYGITYFITTIEAQISPIGIPFAALVVFLGILNFKNLRALPLLLFYFLAHAVALVLFLIWFLHFGYLPEFSTLGLI